MDYCYAGSFLKTSIDPISACTLTPSMGDVNQAKLAILRKEKRFFHVTTFL